MVSFPSPSTGASQEAAHQAVNPTRRILIVDDNQDATVTLQQYLQAQGHEVKCAFDGASGLALAQEFLPQVVLLDVTMPGMDGYEVARHLHEQSPQGARPVLVSITGYGRNAEWVRLKESRFQRQFVKPLDLGALTAFIASLP